MQPLAKEGYVLLIAIAKHCADNYKLDIYKALYPEKLTFKGDIEGNWVGWGKAHPFSVPKVPP